MAAGAGPAWSGASGASLRRRSRLVPPPTHGSRSSDAPGVTRSLLEVMAKWQRPAVGNCHKEHTDRTGYRPATGHRRAQHAGGSRDGDDARRAELARKLEPRAPSDRIFAAANRQAAARGRPTRGRAELAACCRVSRTGRLRSTTWLSLQRSTAPHSSRPCRCFLRHARGRPILSSCGTTSLTCR